MARQNTAPVQFSRSTRTDQGVLMSSGYAGVVITGLVVPFLMGDSGSGTISVDLNLAEMPKPLLNPVFCNGQVWFVPKSAFPQFSGTDEFMNAYTSTSIRALGAADRTPPPFFISSVDPAIGNSDLFKTLGIHIPAGAPINVDWIDAPNLIYNFRLAAHSSKLPMKEYYQEDVAKALAFPPAFWPSGPFAQVVGDYEKALLVGELTLDVQAGQIPIKGLWNQSTAAAGITTGVEGMNPYKAAPNSPLGSWRMMLMDSQGPAADNGARVWAEMSSEGVVTSLADIDKARTTQAFAKLRTAYAGNDTTGFQNDDMILAFLMQGISVPPEYFRRPWLVGQSRVAFGFAERHATDGASLDQSSTTGRTTLNIPVSVPHNDVGGYLVLTLEVLPERLDERQTDEALLITTVDQLPNALRDIQRKEPVDTVLNRRRDARHTAPNGLYGYEQMNAVWNRSFTKLGGVFYQADPAQPFTEARSGIWQAGIVDPNYTEDHFLAPKPFPHDVFADTTAPAFEFVVRHNINIVGNTQIGDPLAENNDDFAAIEDGGLDDGSAAA